ncbi:Iron chelate uptake ABC transporter, FeCT family, permease protein [Acidipropionibacterium acidipropionici ATCC 4875]|uniref:Iron chelate uptake ABC transporter, FeCT family, permease protein n=1 Tax=Acidipropionibacterium acidipropionici (strain ATCC 4875 / DSM 20272 / JCM 6432 / NBRC 12425 / NCIMB 8070 / 4) TaxID=1171373 RepID=K7RSU7_ACIA4|nr:iron chelate uptake ABC transporter family permease subunit [Acidipropionibacterium acidipropionici]AFV87933.1 Iron chelate uptake ABC transporter, FeCT family, permease protein [Acidipropionibacterium acidipropionici ATCC 4875]
MTGRRSSPAPRRRALIGLWSVVLTAALILSAVVVLGVGSVHIPAGDVVDVVARRMRLITGAGVTPLNDEIVWQMRAPRVLGSIAVGALLALSGAILQTLTGNELADPYLLGISSGASVGAVTVLVIGITSTLSQSLLMTLASFAGAVVALVLVLAMATGRSGALPAGRTILAGVAVGQLCGAAVNLLIMVVGQRDVARTAMAWTLGAFTGLRWGSATTLAVVAVVALAVCVVNARILDAFAFGDVSAQSLGIAVTPVRWAFMIGTALVTAVCVAFTGPIGFVGLTVPHIVRLVVGPRHAGVRPLSALAGALLTLWSDTAARSLAPGSEIPVGVITAAVGAPVLVVLLRRQARRS